jgi:S-adenosylmethionine hydrolase
MHVITLTTDFGLDDWFVGAMKGVITRIAPRVQVIDLTHGIPPGDIRAGAFALAAGCRFFPTGTIHLAVVDPGVGSDRNAIAVQTEEYCFVGPDNGVLSFALRNERIKRIHALENKRYLPSSISQTFHGRDVFAPVAAHLAKGVPIQKLGSKRNDLERLSWPEPRLDENGIEGEVVYIDRFGNAITNIDAGMLNRLQAAVCEIGRKPAQKCPVKNCYQAVPTGKPVAVLGSSGFLEIAVNGRSAAKRLAIKIGTKVVARR